MKNTVISVLLVVLVSFAGFVGYMGLFDEWIIDQKPFGPWKIVYIEQSGKYSQTSESIEKIAATLNELQVDPKFPLAVFYGNSREVPDDKLRSDVGFVLNKDDLPKIRQLSSEFKTRDLEKQMYIFTDFPVKNFLSYIIGPMVCYARLQKYCKKMKLKFDYSIELYREGRIYFLVPKVKQEGK